MKHSEYKRIEGAMGPVKYVEVGRVYKVERNNLPLVTAVLFDTASLFWKDEIVHTFLNSSGEIFTCYDTEISLSEGKFNDDIHIMVFQIFNAMIQKQRHERIVRSLENEIAQIKDELARETCYQCHGTGKVEVWAVSNIPIELRLHEVEFIDCDLCCVDKGGKRK